jgi:hypothetical protein
MGPCCSRARYLGESIVAEDAWSNWEHHRARKYYKIGRMLGKGAFSEVCIAWVLDAELGHLQNGWAIPW